MSSYSGTSSSDTTDNSQQLAPSESEGPAFATLKSAFEQCVADSSDFVEQCRNNYDTRFALWSGQSEDGKKHNRDTGKADPTPWDGASDLRVFLVDEAINSKVALYRMAFKKANLLAIPVEGNDLKRAKLVSNFMRWLVQTQMPDVDREVELLANYINEKGVAISGQFWEECEEKTLVTLKIDSLQAQFTNINFAEVLQDPEMEHQVVALFEAMFGCTPSKAKKMMRALRETGKTTVPVVGRRYSRPVFRAFTLDEEIFISRSATDIETAPEIFRLEYFTPTKLRSLVRTDGWDEIWVEKAIEKCKGRRIHVGGASTDNTTTRSRSLQVGETKNDNLIPVVYAYQALSDEDGVRGIYLTVFNPELGDGDGHKGYAKHALLDYAHGQYPFILYRREYLSRRLHDTRGLPEPGKPWQDQIKAHKDSRIDAASLGVLPPIMFPMGRPPSRWGPGAKIPERRQGEYHYADRPMPDMNTENSEVQLRNDFREYAGFASREGDPQFANLKNQNEVDKFLSGLCRAFRQIFALYQQFGDEEVSFRVLGLQQVDPAIFHKGDPKEQYDFYLSWDVQNTDPEVIGTKLDTMAKIIATGDKYGQVDYSEWLQIMLESVDPAIAERIVRPEKVGTEMAVKEEKDALVKIAAGFDEDIKLGAPPQVGMSLIQQWAQSPDVAQRLQGDKAFRSRVEKRMKQYQHQITQSQNAQIGRLGA